MSDSTGSPERLDVVAVAPHPDDLEILCGGTLAKLVKQGYQGRHLRPDQRRADAARLARNAASGSRRRPGSILGVPVRINVDLPNRVLMDGPENRFELATEFRRYRPGIVIIAAGRTPAASPDHHQGHLIGEAARFYSQLTKWDERFDGTAPYRVPHLVYVPFPFEAEKRHWHSQFVVDITDTIDQKIAAVKAYESQFDPTRFERVEHMIRSTNGFHGARCGYLYGELFALPTPGRVPRIWCNS